MNRPVLVVALFAVATASLLAQESSQSSPYAGTSNPPPDDTIITDSAAAAGQAPCWPSSECACHAAGHRVSRDASATVCSGG